MFGFYIGFKCVQTDGHETVFWQANSVSRASTSYFDPLTYQIWIDCFPRWVQTCCHGVFTMAEWPNGTTVSINDVIHRASGLCSEMPSTDFGGYS